MSRVALVIALLAVLGLGACGTDDTAAKNDYVRAVNAAQDRFQRTETRLQEGISTASTTPAQDSRTLDEMATAIGGAVDALHAIDPPKGVASLHRRLVAAVASYRPVVRARRKVVGSDDVRKLISARTAFTTQSQAVNDRVQRAIDAINKALRG